MSRLFRSFYLSLSILIIAVMILGCSTSEKARTGDGIDAESPDIETVNENLTDLQQLLAQNRSKLSDVYTSMNHDMPEVFLQRDSSDASLNSDPFDGYRVQIISTKDQPLADSVANKFRAWADTTIEGYSAQTYVFFNQPFYKVHIGDFQQRKQANSFSKLIKHRYPDAWVVHDRIDPSSVPADTASFSFSKSKELK